MIYALLAHRHRARLPRVGRHQLRAGPVRRVRRVGHGRALRQRGHRRSGLTVPLAILIGAVVRRAHRAARGAPAVQPAAAAAVHRDHRCRAGDPAAAAPAARRSTCPSPSPRRSTDYWNIGALTVRGDQLIVLVACRSSSIVLDVPAPAHPLRALGALRRRQPERGVALGHPGQVGVDPGVGPRRCPGVGQRAARRPDPRISARATSATRSGRASCCPHSPPRWSAG